MLSKPGRRQRLRREDIIDAATKSFYRDGYAATTLATVARELDVTDKALYYYFESKDELYLESYNACMDRIAALIASIGASCESGRARIKSLASALLRQTETLLPFARKLPAHLEHTPLGIRFREAERANTEICIGWVKDGIADGSIQMADPEVLWRSIVGAVVWLGIWSPEGERDEEAFREYLAVQVMVMLDRLLALKGGLH